MVINIVMPTDTLTINVRDILGRLEELRFRPGGVYVFYDSDGGCLYVGQSKSLPDRLRTHITSSPFAHEVSHVTIYFVSDPYEREVYETYAITSLNGRYNRAKKFEQRTANPLINEEIDDTYYEMEDLLRQKTDLEEAIHDIDFRIERKPPRKFNRRTGEFTRKYMDYLDDLSQVTEEDRAVFAKERRERRALVSKIKEIDGDMQTIKVRITKLFSKIAG